MKPDKATLNLILKITIPILLAVAVAWWQFGADFKDFDTTMISWNRNLTLGCVLAVSLLTFREFAMAWRFKSLTSGQLTITDSLKVSLICDFTSAITPTSAGGSLLSMVFLNRRGINIGRATAVTIITLFLDMMFFALVSPLVLLIATPAEVFRFADTATATRLGWIFLALYMLVLIIALILALGIFVKPRSIGNFLIRLTGFKLLSRFSKGAIELADGLNDASAEIKQKSWRWWLQPVLSTVVLWSARLLLVNAIFVAFNPAADQWIIFSRQIIVALFLMFVPTPGGSGVGELLFKTYYADMIHGPVIALMAISWRIFTSYIYLLAGMFVIPSFVRLYKAPANKPTQINEDQ